MKTCYTAKPYHIYVSWIRNYLLSMLNCSWKNGKYHKCMWFFKKLFRKHHHISHKFFIFFCYCLNDKLTVVSWKCEQCFANCYNEWDIYCIFVLPDTFLFAHKSIFNGYDLTETCFSTAVKKCNLLSIIAPFSLTLI